MVYCTIISNHYKTMQLCMLYATVHVVYHVSSGHSDRRLRQLPWYISTEHFYFNHFTIDSCFRRCWPHIPVHAIYLLRGWWRVNAGRHLRSIIPTSHVWLIVTIMMLSCNWLKKHQGMPIDGSAKIRLVNFICIRIQHMNFSNYSEALCDLYKKECRVLVKKVGDRIECI